MRNSGHGRSEVKIWIEREGSRYGGDSLGLLVATDEYYVTCYESNGQPIASTANVRYSYGGSRAAFPLAEVRRNRTSITALLTPQQMKAANSNDTLRLIKVHCENFKAEEDSEMYEFVIICKPLEKLTMKAIEIDSARNFAIVKLSPSRTHQIKNVRCGASWVGRSVSIQHSTNGTAVQCQLSATSAVIDQYRCPIVNSSLVTVTAVDSHFANRTSNVLQSRQVGCSTSTSTPIGGYEHQHGFVCMELELARRGEVEGDVTTVSYRENPTSAELGSNLGLVLIVVAVVAVIGFLGVTGAVQYARKHWKGLSQGVRSENKSEIGNRRAGVYEDNRTDESVKHMMTLSVMNLSSS